ncbi:mandelate racemase [Mycobacterium intracellulare subsp. chimaera]|uniref:enolase C-terminal domain-like protein n=1 Tax=Mycobacterium intracellulare TaxID=1767 RepID=UPI00044E11B5|nr:enolase C-terminal domain-like protein [Mycobacterium intracellulare]AOS93778.1 mandelate racemase [Mycobacterium intracellulare subsp. chimaera]ARV84252.1 mandelate racemase [Mycobacterium intracellulare subsp. chimaera]ASL11575.1 mandelate racemase/muconate lactonizing protein [Mycobacterium intracellulare subsp. chimaera]ASL23525.1 mandelate racemase/muconate lactonizing protein [Mycobacterium intracellulare subsp. chimaera]ETZ27220.1 mandelate racemase/muconate lactonizing enzyme [Mycob
MRIAAIVERAVGLEGGRCGGPANAVVNFSGHTVSLVAVITDVIRGGRPVAGVAFNSIGRFAQSGILRDRMIPRVLAASPDALLDASGFLDPAAVVACALADEKPGGHGDRAAAAGALELACWDLNAKLRDEPACVTIARHAGRDPAPAVPVYAAGGYYYAEGGVERLRREMRGYLDLGYDAVKMKIGGAALGEDLTRIEAVIDAVGDAGRVAVDANGRFDRAQATRWADALAPYGLRWYEEPGDPLDYALHRAVTDRYGGAVATGENLFSVPDVTNLVRYGGMRPNRDVFQMDPGLSYGLGEYLRMLDVLEAHGFDRRFAFPHGGHLINLHVAAGLGLGGCEAYPGVFAPFGGYSDACVVSGGRIATTDAAGFGLEEKAGLAELIAELTGGCG